MVRFLCKLKRPSEKIAGTASHGVLQWTMSFYIEVSLQKPLESTDFSMKKHSVQNKVALQLCSNQSCSLSTGVKHRWNTVFSFVQRPKKVGMWIVYFQKVAQYTLYKFVLCKNHAQDVVYVIQKSSGRKTWRNSTSWQRQNSTTL